MLLCITAQKETVRGYFSVAPTHALPSPPNPHLLFFLFFKAHPQTIKGITFLYTAHIEEIYCRTVPKHIALYFIIFRADNPLVIVAETLSKNS